MRTAESVRRRLHWVALLAVLSTICCFGAGTSQSTAAASASPLIAFAENGSILVIHADGTQRYILTTKGWNSSPHMSPNQRWVAFLGLPRAQHVHPTGNGYPRTLWIASSNGSGTYEAIRGGKDDVSPAVARQHPMPRPAGAGRPNRGLSRARPRPTTNDCDPATV